MGDELTCLLAIFHKIEETGGQATLSVATNSGKTKIKFELVLSPTTSATSTSSLPTSSAALRPASGQRKRSRAARLKAKARAAAHQASLAAAAGTAPVQVPPPPPPPPASTQRLVKVAERKADSRPTFCQLDGEGGCEVDTSEEETEGKGDRIPGVVYCIFCSDYKEPNPVEPTSLIDSHGMKPILKETCDTCNVKSCNIGICQDCHLMSEVTKNTTELHIRCKLCWNAILADPDIP